MAIYYVSKTGNDTTGDGSLGNPWLTIVKAKNTVSASGNHTVNIGAGTYAESDGGGYMVTNKSFVAPVIFQSQTGNPGDVVLTSSSGAYNIYQNGAFSNWTFKNITIQARTGTDCFTFNQSVAISGLTFENCTFIADGTGSTRSCFNSASATPASSIVQTVTFKKCIFKAWGGTAGWGIRASVHASAPTGTKLTIYADQCRSDDGTLNVGIEAGPGCDVHVTGGRWFGVAGKGVLIAIDGPVNARSTTGGVYGSHVKSSAAHAYIVGGGAQSVKTWGCIFQNGDHSVVIKAATNATMKHCISEAGTINALLLKGVSGGNFQYNFLRSAAIGSAPIFANYDGDQTYINTGFKVEKNLFVMVGATSKAIRWDPEGDGGENILNETVYHDRRTQRSLSWGQVLQDSDVADPVEIHQAFVAGGEPRNEMSQGASLRMVNYRHNVSGAFLYTMVFDRNGEIYSADGITVYRPEDLGFRSKCTIPLYEETPFNYGFIWPNELPAGSYTLQIFSTAEYGFPSDSDTYLGSICLSNPDVPASIKSIQNLENLAVSSLT